MLILAACGGEDTEEAANEEEANDTESVEETDTESPADADEDGVDDSTEESAGTDATEEDADAKEVLSQSMEAMEQLNSYSMEMDMNQSMNIDGEEIPMDMLVNMDVILDPVSFSQTMVMPDPVSGEDIEIEQYMDEDGSIYMQDPESDEWIMMDGSMLGMDNLDELMMSPQEQLEMLEAFTSNLNLEEEENRFVLTIEGSGDELMELSRELATMQQTDPQMEQMLGQMGINDMNYVMYINKETFYLDEMEIDMEMEMSAEGETMMINQVTHGIFSAFDEIDQIEIPQEAIDNAIDLEDMEDTM